jgi:uncharacterized protein (DUF488 family)
VKAEELKFGMNILRFGIFGNSLKNFLKNSEILLKKCPKFSYNSLGRSWRAEIRHELALLVASSNYILRFDFFLNSLKSSSEKF